MRTWIGWTAAAVVWAATVLLTVYALSVSAHAQDDDPYCAERVIMEQQLVAEGQVVLMVGFGLSATTEFWANLTTGQWTAVFTMEAVSVSCIMSYGTNTTVLLPDDMLRRWAPPVKPEWEG